MFLWLIAKMISTYSSDKLIGHATILIVHVDAFHVYNLCSSLVYLKTLLTIKSHYVYTGMGAITL